MDLQNLSYALVQLVHNFGAAAVLGGAVCARWPARQSQDDSRALAMLVLLAWLVQAASGIGFGATSYIYYGRLPDIHGIAIVALFIKIACAIAGILVASAYLKREAAWTGAGRTRAWNGLALLAATALTAAAFLRWFS